MTENLLFNDLKQNKVGLTETQRLLVSDEIIMKAKLSMQYFYTLKEACVILKCPYRSLLPIIKQYKLDVVLFRDVHRIPWYDLAAYLLTDHEDNLEKDYYEYMRTVTK